MIALLAALKPPRLALAALACLVSFGLGYRQRGLEDAKAQYAMLARTTEQQRKQQEEAAKRDAANESAHQALKQRTEERTRDARKAAGRHPEPVDARVLRRIDAAADAP